MTALDRLNIKSSLERFDVVFDRVLILDRGFYLLPCGLGELALMVNIQKLFGLLGVQIESIATNKLQCIPGGRIVTGGNGDSSIRFEPGHGQLETGRRTNSKINNLTTRCEQPGYDC